MQTGQMDQALQLQQSMGGKMDYSSVLSSMIPSDPQGAMKMAISVCQKDNSQNVHQFAEIFLRFNRLAELTQFLLECMK
jgi:type II secretory pathway component PulL